jgi:phage terminase small subunit
MARKKLTGKQQAFVNALICEPTANLSTAARKAGYTGNVGQTAFKLLKNKAIKAQIDSKRAQVQRKVSLDGAEVLRELHAIGTSDLAGAFQENGDLKPIHDIPEVLRRTISGIDVDVRFEGRGADAVRIVTKKLRFWPKDRALEMLGKHLKLFTEVHEHRFGVGLADRVKEARERVKRT